MIANVQQQSCKEQFIGNPANVAIMAEADRDLIEALASHAKTSPTDLARRAGLTPSTLTRPLNQPVKHRLSAPTLDKLRAAVPDFPGWRDVPLLPNAKVLRFGEDELERPPENLPVVGTAMGAARIVEGEAIEQTDLNSGHVEEFVRRPAILRGKHGAYALHVQGSSMHPALPEGEMVVACRGMPLGLGDNVVVYLRDELDDDGNRARAVLVKELVRRSASWVELRQYEPRLDFRVSMADVVHIDRILSRQEMLS